MNPKTYIVRSGSCLEHAEEFATIQEAIACLSLRIAEFTPATSIAFPRLDSSDGEGGYGEDGSQWHSGLTDDEQDQVDEECG